MAGSRSSNEIEIKVTDEGLDEAVRRVLTQWQKETEAQVLARLDRISEWTQLIARRLADIDELTLARHGTEIRRALDMTVLGDREMEYQSIPWTLNQILNVMLDIHKGLYQGERAHVRDKIEIAQERYIVDENDDWTERQS